MMTPLSLKFEKYAKNWRSVSISIFEPLFKTPSNNKRLADERW